MRNARIGTNLASKASRGRLPVTDPFGPARAGEGSAGMSLKPLARVRPLRRVLYRLARCRVKEKLVEITPTLALHDHVLDVGSGNCVLCQQLRRRGYDIVPVDIDDLSFVRDTHPVVYNGERLPFEDDSFDVALVVTVLHHTRDPDALLAEAKRVAKRVVVIEEVYRNCLEKYVTYSIDSLFNLEFLHHPHSNRTDRRWRYAFEGMGLRVDDAHYTRSLGVLRRVTYDLARPSTS